MTFDSLVNRGDYFSAHYLAEVLPRDLRSGLLATWKEREDAARAAEAAPAAADDQKAFAEKAEYHLRDAVEPLPVTPRAGLRALRRPYFRTRAIFAVPEQAEGVEPILEDPYGDPLWRQRVRYLNASVLRALGIDANPQVLALKRADQPYQAQVAHYEKGLVALDCGWATDPDDALDPEGPGRLLDPMTLEGRNTVATGAKLASFLFACEDPPRYVVLLVGGVVILADRAVWGEGRYLAVSLDAALERNDTKLGGELDTIAALFGADSLRTPEEGGENPLAELVGKSTKHAVGVSSDLRDGLRQSIELIANEVLDRIREHDVRPEDVMELPELGRQLTRESLRYLYRILFLLYAEARPELGILPADYPEYQQGYGLSRLGELVAERDLVDETSRRGTYLYQSLDLLFRKVQDGYRPRRTHGEAAHEERASEDIGLRFESLHSKLFEADSILLIGCVPDPRGDTDTGPGSGSGEDGEPRLLDTRLRNATLYRVLRLLMLTKGRKGERGGFISYAQLGINQLGAVYEGLMSYSGFIAGEELYEVAKGGDPKDGLWLVPRSKVDDYPDSVFVRRRDEETGEELRVRHAEGSFVYRLSGRDRQTSASYYTPESLTKVTVQLALQHRLDQDGTVTAARELLDWKICEPALGSGAFLNEAINQVAAEYLRRRQDELGTPIDTERYAVELQKAKAYIALHNSYGVDLNETAVELAEVSLWLNTMHPGMEAPWFGLHLRRGNSLIGGRREVYPAEKLRKAAWLGTTPERFPLTQRDESVPTYGLPLAVSERKTRSGDVQRASENAVHHFLLPAKEWGAVAGEKEAKALAPEAAKALGAWRKAITRTPTARQSERLQGLARRVEYLWGLVVRRLEISERDISRRIDVWGAENGWLRSPEAAVQRDEVVAELRRPDSPYWRLKTLMDVWCALWFWPVQAASLLDGTDEVYARASAVATAGQPRHANLFGIGGPEPDDSSAEADKFSVEDGGILQSWEVEALPGFEADPQQLTLTRESVERRRTGRRREAVHGDRRSVIALATLDDWLDFAESLVGTQEVPAESLVSEFSSLEELTPYEEELPRWMGMDDPVHLGERYLWLDTARDISEQQGFFHWELEYAQVFARGGYDLQVGNPPWVRPQWQENLILAEIDPWFALEDKPPASEWKLRRQDALDNAHHHSYFLDEFTRLTGAARTLGSPEMYPLLGGSQPDLYRCFMCQVWRNSSKRGTSGLIHPDSHFNGTNTADLRAATYPRLRMHAHFSNLRAIFPEIRVTRQFGVNIYGCEQEVNFTHASWIFDPLTLIRSFEHDGSGEYPGMRHSGTWDVRPHRSRLLPVNRKVLANWHSLTGSEELKQLQTPLIYPISTGEQGAVDKLARSLKFGPHPSRISSGYNEKGAKDDGTIQRGHARPATWEEVILRGPHFSVGNPFSKESPRMGRSDPFIDVSSIPAHHIPATDYQRASSIAQFKEKQDKWNGRAFTEYLRLAWRKMIPFDTERSLFVALIPPGPAHIDAVISMALKNNKQTVLTAGFWASLPLDYMLRIAGKANLHPADVGGMPSPDSDNPLGPPLVLRTLRLNCLTEAYAPAWRELFDRTWCGYENWAYDGWANLRPLAGKLTSNWEYSTPLRTEYERRAALVEVDAIVSVWLGISADQLVAIYRSRYPVLSDYESEMYFDAKGRKIARNHNTYGHGQSKEAYPTLLEHLASPEVNPPPEGYVRPFYKADREAEMRGAHAHFQARLNAEIAAGRWTAPAPTATGPAAEEEATADA